MEESTNKQNNNMKKQESEKLNTFLAFLYKRSGGKITYKELALEAQKQLGVTISGDAVRKRIKDGGASHKVDLFDKELQDNNFDGTWAHGWLKTEGASIFIRKPNGDFMTYTDMRDEIIAEMEKYAPKYPKIKRSKKEGHLLLADPADVHFGKLSVDDETGEEYNLEIAEKRFNEGIDGLINKAEPFGIHSSVLVIGNDILHIDSPRRMTTSGTPQDTDGMWWQAFQVAKRCYIRAVEKLMQLGDVKLVFCPSNHDFMSGYMLSDSIVSWFSKSKNVTAHASISHRKYVKYGNNLIGLTHGDGAKGTDLPNLMMTEARGTDFVFGTWIVHHGHHKDKFVKRAGYKKVEKVEEDDMLINVINTAMNIDPGKSISVEMVRSPSAPDRWHYTNGYKNIQAIEAFIFHPEGGQVARLTHNF